MENIRLPPPIVIAPIDDDVPDNSQDPGSHHNSSAYNMESRNMGVPVMDPMPPLQAMAQQNQTLFGPKYRSGFLPYNYPSGTTGMLPPHSTHFAPPTAASHFHPELNNNSSYQPNPNGLPRFPPYGHTWPQHLLSPYMQNQGNVQRNKGPVPPHLLPAHNGQAFGEVAPMGFEQSDPFRHPAFPPTYPPPIFDQYNLASNNISKRHVLPFGNTLPMIPGHDQTSVPQQTSPQLNTVDNISVCQVSFQTIDGKRIPCVQRNNELFTSVRSVEVKLLSKFPNTYPEEVKKRPPIKSTKMTKQEADAFNRINNDNLYEYGMESFENDLLVRFHDFENFYSIIKKYFPNTPPCDRSTAANSGSPPSAVTSCAQGGWLQLNNTIIPYIKRGNQKYLPMCIVKYAAGLPISDNPFVEVLSSEECRFMNEQCQLAGLKFSFHNRTVIGSLDKILQYLNTTLVIKELPMTNPFDSASYDPSLEPNQNESSITGNQPTEKTSTVTSNEQPIPQMPPLIRMGKLENRLPTKSTHQANDIMNELQQMADPLHKQRGSQNMTNSAKTAEGLHNERIQANMAPVPKHRTPSATFESQTGQMNKSVFSNSKKCSSSRGNIEKSLHSDNNMNVRKANNSKQNQERPVATDLKIPHYVFKAKDKKSDNVDNHSDTISDKTSKTPSKKRSTSNLVEFPTEENRSHGLNKMPRKEANDIGSASEKITKKSTEQNANKKVPQVRTPDIMPLYVYI